MSFAETRTRPGPALAAAAGGVRAVCQPGTTALPQPSAAIDRIRLMGGDLDLVTPGQVMDFIARRADRGQKGVVANHNLHSLYLLRRDAGIRAFFQKADLIEIDSTPLIAWGRLLGHPVQACHRSTYLDWREQFWALAEARGWRVFLLGSKPGVADAAIERLRGRWPQLHLEGRHGYFDHASDSAGNLAVVEAVNAFRPHVVLVGMGMPIQEAWIAQNEARLASGVLLSVGGAFDYEAGVQIPAPRWLGRIGLEWLFRFTVQPKRLFNRYFVEPWSLIGPALGDIAAARR